MPTNKNTIHACRGESSDSPSGEPKGAPLRTFSPLPLGLKVRQRRGEARGGVLQGRGVGGFGLGPLTAGRPQEFRGLSPQSSG